MKIGRVVGTVVSTINAPVFDDRTLLICDLLDPRLEPSGGYVIAIDTVGAGAGEVVLILDEGSSARQVLRSTGGDPVRTLVVGIVDEVAVAAPPGTRRPAGRARASRGDAPARRASRRPLRRGS